MKFSRHKYILYSLGLVILIIGFAACDSTMHDSYEEFIKDGTIIYPATMDSIKVHPGKNRIKLSFLLPSDPTVSKARVYWHTGQDSVEVSIDRDQKVDTMDVMLTDMQEGSYTFDIYTYDDEGNSSIRATAIGRVYGDNYISSLLPRMVKRARFINNTLEVEWGAAEETIVATEISYTDTSGASQLMYIPAEDGSTTVADYDFDANDTFQYRTMYLPDSMAIDTFYSAKIPPGQGPPVELSKEGWTATASSYDERHGDARAPGSAIDNDPGTIWVNSIVPQTFYPHSITVDMGSVKGIDGLTFIVQQRNETPETIEILVSRDSTSWTPMGRFIVENTTTVQYINFLETQDIRYFEVVAIEPHGGTNNIVIPELGTYRR